MPAVIYRLVSNFSILLSTNLSSTFKPLWPSISIMEKKGWQNITLSNIAGGVKFLWLLIWCSYIIVKAYLLCWSEVLKFSSLPSHPRACSREPYQCLFYNQLENHRLMVGFLWTDISVSVRYCFERTTIMQKWLNLCRAINFRKWELTRYIILWRNLKESGS